jgi:NAD(P)-dependent dehydrogenase (short-subunit alcohol dehydrogenase family)
MTALALINPRFGGQQPGQVPGSSPADERIGQPDDGQFERSAAGASILLFSSVAVRTGMPFHASVGAAKGAVEGLARSLAAELAPHIRVNVIAASLTDTPLAAGLLSSDEKRQAAAKRHPLQRIGSPQDVARMAALLLSEAASWITGQVIPIDGGMGALRVFR